jgi:hypothetical protein
MEAKVLETFPFWPAYIVLTVFGVFLLSCLWVCGVHILAAFVAPRVPYKRIPGYASTALMTVCALIAFWLMFSMMFVRFHEVRLGGDHIELVYCWPRPNVSLDAASLRSSSIHYYRGKGCRLEIFSDRARFRSVDSDELEAAEQVDVAVNNMTKR